MNFVPVHEIEHWIENIQTYTVAANWFKDHIAQPHPELSRKGPICPFTRTGLKLGTILLRAVRFEDTSQQAVISVMLEAIEDFVKSLNDAPTRNSLALAVLLPDIQDSESYTTMIDDVHRKLKPSFVARGVMIGEFHPESTTPSADNPDFVPGRSPVAMLVLRSLVPTDLKFLNFEHDAAITRIGFLRSYLNFLEPDLTEREKYIATRTLTMLTNQISSWQ